MSVRAFFHKRRQRKARKRYEQEKARREFSNSPDALKQAEEWVKRIGGSGFGG